MKPHKLLLVAATFCGLLASSVHVAEAAKKSTKSTKDAQIEALTRRLEILEQRLAVSEGKGQTQDSAATSKTANLAGADIPAVKQLDQKFKVLERKLEVSKETADAEKKTASKFSIGSEGFKWSSADDTYKFQLRGLINADSAFFLDDSVKGAAGLNNTTAAGPANATPVNGFGIDRFQVSRARLLFSGSVGKYTDFLITPEFGATCSGGPCLFDAWVDLHYFNFASLTAGKQKGPGSLERLQDVSKSQFVDLSYPTQLAPNRDIGILLHGEFTAPGRDRKSSNGLPANFKDLFQYQAGVFNGTADNTNVANVTTTTYDNKEFQGRIFAHPFQLTDIGPLQGLGMGLAGTYGQPKSLTPVNLQSPGQNVIVTYNTGTALTGDHHRLIPQGYWYYGPFGVFTEYAMSWQTLTSATSTTVKQQTINQQNTGWQVATSYVVTGEDNTFQGVKPRKPFDPFSGDWGALQVLARWSELGVDKDTFTNIGTAKTPFYGFANPAGSVKNATTWTVGFNWFLSNNVKIVADYEQTYFKGGAASTLGTPSPVMNRPMERVFLTRFQLSF